MKIELDHESENIEEIIETGTYTDLPEGVTKEDVQATLTRFNQTFQAFEVGTLIAYLATKIGEEIQTMSRVMEIMVADMGYDKFLEFTTSMGDSYDETVEAYKAEQATQEAEQALEGDVGDVGDDEFVNTP